jgi:hypothetical protein
MPSLRLSLSAAALCVVAACGSQHGVSAPSRVAAPAPAVLGLRTVVASSAGACRAAALTAYGPGRACGLDDQTTYQLSGSLAELTVSHAAVQDDPVAGRSIAVELDAPSKARFATVAKRVLGQQLATLVNGRVVTVVRVDEPIDDAQLRLAPDLPAAFTEVAEELRVSPPSAHGGSALPTYDAEQAAVCRRAQPRLAPGMRIEREQILGAPHMTAADAVRLLTAEGETATAATWSRQPAGERVYECIYVGSTTVASAVPSCPPGHDPVVDETEPTREFFVDASGHASERKLSPPRSQPPTCAPR